ncbi:MAG: fibronectin type III domain-containing protein [Oscillospiraceae bacterium]|jgi:hypothetical protein|nr:fibronectin type III domain-containing protein [Oscillospiraceae bacterium]
MKRKKYLRVLGYLLAITMLTGFLVATVSADTPEITFLNPLGEVEPIPNQPLADRLTGLSGKTIRLLQYGAANTSSQLAMASLQSTLNAAGATALAPAAFPGTAYDAKTAAQYNTWATGADAVIIGVLEDNVSAWWSGYHAREIEARGVPVVLLTTDAFSKGVTVGIQDNGIAALRVVSIPSLPWADAQGYGTTGTPTPRRTYIDNNIVGGTVNIGASVISALTAPLTNAEKSAAPLTVAAMGIPYADGTQTLSVRGANAVEALPAFYDLSMQLGFGDGLPLVLPTQAAVDAMLAGQGVGERSSDEILGKVMLRGGIMTVEKVAINAVMAGARPQHFPVILAAMEAYANAWEDNKLFYNDVISNDQRTLAMVVSGPIVGAGAEQLDLSRGRQYNPGSNDSSSIGRAVMLAIRNIGHIAHENSVVMGATYRINAHEVYVVAEANELLPPGWETLSEQMGFGTGSNTVTLLSLSSARFTGNVGGTSAGGTAGTFDNWATIRTQGTAANLFNSPGIWLIHSRDAEFAASTDTRARAAGGLSTAARGLSNKTMVQQFIAGTGGTVVDNGPSPTTNIVRSPNREALIWPIVSGLGHSTNGRVFHGGSADYNDSRGFHTQRVGGATAPSAPLSFAVNTATPGQAVLTWAAPARGTVVKYEVSGDDGRTWIDAGSATTYTFSGLNAGQQYFFAVRAKSAVQNSVDVRAPGAGGVAAARLDWNASGRGAWAIAIATAN